MDWTLTFCFPLSQNRCKSTELLGFFLHFLIRFFFACLHYMSGFGADKVNKEN